VTRVILLTAVAMLAFAANSLLARIGVRDGLIDAGSFTALRLISGALGLWILVAWQTIGLLLPGLSAPPLGSAVIMLVSGVAWGVYSLLGRGVSEPLAATANNFLLTVPLAVLLALVTWSAAHISAPGVFYAVLSGVLASGAGYAIWYTALPALSSPIAATVQLSVPVIAAVGGVLLLAEPLSLRLILGSVAVLGRLMRVTGLWLFSGVLAAAPGWQAATSEQVRDALSDRTLYFGLTVQTFYASGRTLYDAGRPSWGRWRVQGDQYCSQWPPQDTWTCYDVVLSADGKRVRFVGQGNDVSTGVYDPNDR